MFTLYTKKICPFCVKAKKELDKRNLEYKEIILTKDNREELLSLAPNAKTVPQIFLDNAHIGGYEELMQYFKEKEDVGTT